MAAATVFLEAATVLPASQLHNFALFYCEGQYPMALARSQKSLISFGKSCFPRLLTSGAVVAASIVATPYVHAQSQPTRGFYVGAGAGLNLEEDNRFRNGGGNSTDSYHVGYAGILNFGYGLGNGLRLEFEPGYRNNRVENVNGAPADSRTQIATFMGNVIYDFNWFQTPWLPLTPHIGVGIGDANVWDRSRAPSGNNVSGSTNRLAVQAIGGLDYSLTPNQKVGLDYRYLLVHNASFPTVAGPTAHAGDLNNHAVLLTYRYEFNQPAPPPRPAAAVTTAAPPPPPPAPAPHPYEVYFEFDRATLTPDARQVVQEAAQNAMRGNATSIVATGHTDTVGTSSYNLALSRRRAAAVKTELVKDGVPAGEISTNGVGMNDLAVSTGPGVNEPRNRRVEITVEGPGM